MECGSIVIVLLSFSFPPAASKRTGGVALAPSIERLLDFSNEPSAKAVQALEHTYRSLPAAVRGKPQVKYAYAVALLRQKRYQDASRALHELADDGQASDAALWRAKLWVELELDERVRVMTDLEQLSSHGKAHLEAGGERSADMDSAQFFGTVCGFLAGPWSHRVREDDAKIIEDRLRSVFDDASQTAFDEAKAKLVERYEKLCQEHEEHAQAEQAAKTKELDDEKAAVGRKAQDLGQQQQSIKDKHAKRDADAKAKMGDIEAQLKKLDQQRQVLFVQMAPLEAERAALVAQLMPLMMYPFLPQRDKQAMNAMFPRQSAYTYNRRIQRMLAPLVTKLTLMEGQLASLNQQEMELRGQGFMTEVKHQTELGKLAQQEQTLDKDRKRVKYDAQRLKAKSVGSSPQLRAEAEQLTRFGTYAPFPFESEKARLLAEKK